MTHRQVRNVALQRTKVRQPGSISLLLLVAILMASPSPSRAEDVAPSGQRKLLGEFIGDSVPHPCTSADCATVLAVRHGDLQEYGPTATVQGPVSRQPPFGRYDPYAPPITQPGFMVQKQTDVWVIEVRRRDGTVQSFQQSFPVLFQVGDEVIVDGDRVHAPD